MTLRVMICAAAIAALIGSSGQADAADQSRRYALDGGGRLSCERFLSARDERGRELALFAGWVEGYFSAFNQFNADVYDVTPWQTVELLLAKLAAFCRSEPDTPFAAATAALAQTLYPDRISRESEVVSIRASGQAVFLYAAMVDRIRAALATRGFSPGDGTGFDQATADALAAFQASAGLPVSRLPDQPTLNALDP